VPLEYAKLPSSLISRIALEEGVVAVVPLGSLEQHCEGPLGLDSMIAERLAFEACVLLERRSAARCVILPTLYYGFSPEWSKVKGTISVPLDVYVNLLKAIVRGLVKAGFKRIAFINTHGGNAGIAEAYISEAASEVGGVVLALINYWELLNIKLDHAGPVEESIAKALGVAESMGECSRIGYRSRPRITATPPEEPSTIAFENQPPNVDVGELIEALARALETVAKTPTSEKLI